MKESTILHLKQIMEQLIQLRLEVARDVGREDEFEAGTYSAYLDTAIIGIAKVLP